MKPQVLLFRKNLITCFFFLLSSAVFGGNDLDELTKTDYSLKANITKLTALSKDASDQLTALMLQLKTDDQLKLEQVKNFQQQLQNFSGAFFNYRIQRTIVWTSFFAKAADRVAQSEPQIMATKLAPISQLQSKLMQTAEEIQYYNPTIENLRGWSIKMAALTDEIMRINRDLLLQTYQFQQDFRSQSNLGLRFKSILIRWMQSIIGLAERFVLNRIYESIKKGESFWPTIARIVETKYKLAGFSFDIQATFGEKGLKRDSSGKAKEINIFLAPHGSPDEVAYVAAKINQNLTNGRKAATVSAVYHFAQTLAQKDYEKGLAIGNHLAAHPEIIAVLGQLSVYKSENIVNDSIFKQLDKAIDRDGITDLILFPEGRSSAFDGGFTPIHPNTARALIQLADQLRKRADPIALKVTILGATFPNLTYDLGREKGTLALKEIAEITSEDLLSFDKSKELLNSSIEYLWHRFAIEKNPQRFASINNDSQLIEELSTRPELLIGNLSCKSISEYISSR